MLRQVEDLVAAGIPVMAHLGLTPQSVNAFGGYRVQGRGEDGEQLLHDAKALQAAGAFSVRARGGAGRAGLPGDGQPVHPDDRHRGRARTATPRCWSGRTWPGCPRGAPKFVRRYADVGGVLREAARSFAEDVVAGRFPDEEHSYR